MLSKVFSKLLIIPIRLYQLTISSLLGQNCAYHPPKKYAGSVLDGRDITYKIIPDADFKFFVTASIKVRAQRRFKELKKIKKNISFIDILKSIKR